MLRRMRPSSSTFNQKSAERAPSRTSYASAIACAFVALTGCGGVTETRPRNDDAGASADAASSGLVPLSPAQADALRAQACVPFEPPPIHVAVEFVVEASSALDQGSWTTVRDTVNTALIDLPDISGAGLVVFPNRTGVAPSATPRPTAICIDTSAAISIDVLDTTHRDVLQSALFDAAPAGGAPVLDAWQWGLAQLKQSSLSDVKFMVLITAGTPTFGTGCVGNETTPSDPQPIIDALGTAATNDGIRTFVVGAPGSESARAWLSRAARAGGTAPPGCSDTGPLYCHYDMTSGAAVSTAIVGGISQLAEATATCSFVIGRADPASIRLLLTGADGQVDLVERRDSPDCVEGWYPQGDLATLCPSTCARLDPRVSTVEILDTHCP